MVNFQFLSGLNTIGSNIIDIQAQSGRVIFDYGAIVDSESGGLADFEEETEDTAIFISHLHLDHTGSLQYVPKHIPIYMSRESYELYKAFVEVGESAPISAEIIPVDYGSTIRIGEINVTLKESDHDIKGVCAFFVQTPDIKLINSGDVRLTGNFPEKVKAWVEEAKDFQADLLLLEGTSFSFIEEEPVESPDEEKVERIHSEPHLYEEWAKLLKENDTKVTFINTYIRNTDRLTRLSKQAFQQGKKMVLEPAYASILENIEGYTETLVLKELDKKKQFEDRWISMEEIVSNPEKYVLQNSIENISLIEPFSEGLYCHSNGEPLGDFDPRYEPFIQTIEKNNFEFKNFGTSGHANKEDLIWLAQEINAKTTIPWHSLYPEEFAKKLIEADLNTFLPQRDLIYGIQKKEH